MRWLACVVDGFIESFTPLDACVRQPKAGMKWAATQIPQRPAAPLGPRRITASWRRTLIP